MREALVVPQGIALNLCRLTTLKLQILPYFEKECWKSLSENSTSLLNGMKMAIMLGKFLSSKPVIAKEKLLMSNSSIFRKLLNCV
jgi:hypothetical protein